VTNKPTSPGSHDALDTGSKLTTLDPGAGYTTIINRSSMSSGNPWQPPVNDSRSEDSV
jgi:hypothetical protein